MSPFGELFFVRRCLTVIVTLILARCGNEYCCHAIDQPRHVGREEPFQLTGCHVDFRDSFFCRKSRSLVFCIPSMMVRCRYDPVAEAARGVFAAGLAGRGGVSERSRRALISLASGIEHMVASHMGRTGHLTSCAGPGISAIILERYSVCLPTRMDDAPSEGAALLTRRLLTKVR